MRQRTWETPEKALTVVVLSGLEQTRLCPQCLHVRLQAQQGLEAIVGVQADLFPDPPPPAPGAA